MNGLPPWCDVPETVDTEAVAAIVRTKVAWIVGPALAGATSLGAAALQRLIELGFHPVALRVWPGVEADDLWRGLGTALGAFPTGDRREVLRAIARVGQVAIFLDDADLAPHAMEPLLALDGVQLVLTGRWAGVRPTVQLGEPPAERLEVFKRQLDALPAGAEVLAELPMGVPNGSGWHLPAGLQFPLDDRTAFNRAAREALGIRGETSTEALASAMRDRLSDATSFALDQTPGSTMADLVFYRDASRRVADPDLAAIATAAFARLLLRHGDADLALERLRATASFSPRARALVHAVEGDVRLWLGDAEAADLAYADAVGRLSEIRESATVSALARRCAVLHAARGNAARARRWLAEARATTSPTEDAVGWADALRIHAELSVDAREYNGASALFDEAFTAIDRAGGDERARRERAAISLGRAAMAIGQGEYAAAGDALDRAKRDTDDPSLTTGIAFRRAELAFRRNRPELVEPALHEAAAAAASRGDTLQLTQIYKLRGDLLATEGDNTAAVAWWAEATRLCRITQDLAAIRPLLQRLALYERDGSATTNESGWQAAWALVEAPRGMRY